MSVTQRRRFAVLAVAIGGLVMAAGAGDALAQAPFGVRPSVVTSTDSGLVGWLLAQQAQFYRALSGLIRAAKADGTAVWTLLGVSFLYGVVHAAGPGHGKAVISSYLIANEETWRRGVVLSFASALLQALVAVTVVTVAALALNVTARTMNEAVRWIEAAGYALTALIGVRLVIVKGREFLRVLDKLRVGSPAPVPALALAGDVHAGRLHHDHVHGREHGPYENCGCGDRHDAVAGTPPHSTGRHHHHHEDCCSHGPAPEDLAGPGGWSRGLAAIVAVGLRPCSGAILILVFALSQGLVFAGVGSVLLMGLGTGMTVATIATLTVGAKTFAVRLAGQGGGSGALLLHGVELAAACAVLVFGLALLTGYMASERMI
jgi:nickel/cobalt exporter